MHTEESIIDRRVLFHHKLFTPIYIARNTSMKRYWYIPFVINFYSNQLSDSCSILKKISHSLFLFSCISVTKSSGYFEES